MKNVFMATSFLSVVQKMWYCTTECHLKDLDISLCMRGVLISVCNSMRVCCVSFGLFKLAVMKTRWAVTKFHSLLQNMYFLNTDWVKYVVYIKTLRAQQSGYYCCIYLGPMHTIYRISWKWKIITMFSFVFLHL